MHNNWCVGIIALFRLQTSVLSHVLGREKPGRVIRPVK